MASPPALAQWGRQDVVGVKPDPLLRPPVGAGGREDCSDHLVGVDPEQRPRAPGRLRGDFRRLPPPWGRKTAPLLGAGPEGPAPFLGGGPGRARPLFGSVHGDPPMRAPYLRRVTLPPVSTGVPSVVSTPRLKYPRWPKGRGASTGPADVYARGTWNSSPCVDSQLAV